MYGLSGNKDYYYSEHKGADQLRGYREADLRLCFRICKSRFSHDAAHIVLGIIIYLIENMSLRLD